MAKPSQTFKKRQRENKLRERALMKRERQQQRAMERKRPEAADQADSDLPVPQEIEQAPSYDRGGESNT
jgi:hypothetical protein